jgi:hypothetical protein
MKNKDDVKICMNIIYNNYDDINNYYKLLLIYSNIYPYIDFEVTSKFLL